MEALSWPAVTGEFEVRACLVKNFAGPGAWLVARTSSWQLADGPERHYSLPTPTCSASPAAPPATAFATCYLPLKWPIVPLHNGQTVGANNHCTDTSQAPARLIKAESHRLVGQIGRQGCNSSTLAFAAFSVPLHFPVHNPVLNVRCPSSTLIVFVWARGLFNAPTGDNDVACFEHYHLTQTGYQLGPSSTRQDGQRSIGDQGAQAPSWPHLGRILR